MNDNKIKRIVYNIFILAMLCNFCIYSQDCDAGYNYIEFLPDIISNENNEDHCFFSNELDVISELISLNALDYPNELDVGVQSWDAGHLVYWVLTYSPNGSNGVNKQLTVLPDNIGNLTSLRKLYLEWKLSRFS